jgi:hypothetical protein
MTRAFQWALAGAVVFMLASAPAFAQGAPAAPDDFAARFKAQCEKRGLSAEECDKQLKQHEERRAKALERQRERCSKQGITNDEECQAWIKKQRETRREAARKRFEEQCKAKGLSLEECRKQRREERAKRHEDYMKFRQDCTAKGLSDAECRRQYRQSLKAAPKEEPKDEDGNDEGANGE